MQYGNVGKVGWGTASETCTKEPLLATLIEDPLPEYKLEYWVAFLKKSYSITVTPFLKEPHTKHQFSRELR